MASPLVGHVISAVVPIEERKTTNSNMRIENLYVYPIKSLRGISLDSSPMTRFGLPYDRRFLLLQVVDDEKTGEKTYKNMVVSSHYEMVRFFPEIHVPDDGDASKGRMTVTFKPVDGSPEKMIDVPLQPDTKDLAVLDIEMHKSPTQGYKMPDRYNEWFSACFGYDAILTYIGENIREVRMSSNKFKASSKVGSGTATTGWLTSITTRATEMITGNGTSADDDKPSEIKFSDLAPYLIVSSKSMDDVHTRLPGDENFDITKFRPNIIVSGASKPWEEDYWGELTFNSRSSNNGNGGGVRIECEHNCNRCVSINVDYATGAQGKGEAGTMLKKLSKDRRVDRGAKWSPIFGRYGFLHYEDCVDGEEGEVRVGNEVVVSRWNSERTDFGMLCGFLSVSVIFRWNNLFVVC